MTAWHEDDSFWRVTGSTMFIQKRWETAVKEVDQLLALLRLPEGASILDLPCGPGRHSLELLRRGFRVTSVDRTAAYLAELEERSAKEGISAEALQADMRDFNRPESFDAAINLFTSFGYFEDQDEDRKALRNFYASLKPGGKLLIDLLGKEILARVFRERDWHRTEDGAIVLEERKLRDGWGWIDIRWILLEGEERRELTFGHRLYSGAELSALLREAGFSSVRCYGGLAGGPYDQTAPRLAVLAQK